MNYRNAQYTEDGRINCEIEHSKFGWIPFTADSNDVEEFGRNLFEQISSNGDIVEFVPPLGPSEEEIALKVRSKRNSLLSSSDWTQLPDAPVDQAAWANYRQNLRNIPNQEGFPENVIWPIEPE